MAAIKSYYTLSTTKKENCVRYHKRMVSVLVILESLIKTWKKIKPVSIM
jgi:hypothetical protein